MNLRTNEVGVIENPAIRNVCINQVAGIVIGGVEKSLGRSTTIPERNLVGWEPRCLAW